MNKLFSSLVLCSAVGIAISLCGSPAQVTLNTGATIDIDAFNFYAPIIEGLCRDNPNSEICRKLAIMTQWRNTRIYGEDHDTLTNLGVLDGSGHLKPACALLVQASLKEQGLKYYDPRGHHNGPANSAPAGNMGTGKPW